MPTIANLKDLGKRERARILREHRGLLARVARETGKTEATVSRVFNGRIDTSPEVEAAIRRELEKIQDAA